MKLWELNSIIPQYNVVDEQGYALGQKLRAGVIITVNNHENKAPLYLKPEYDKKGNRVGGKWASIDSRVYKGTPPWFRYEVILIDNLGGSITVHVHATKGF